MEIAFYLLIGAAFGAFGMWLWHRGLWDRIEDLKSERARLGGHADMLQRQLSAEQTLTATLEERATRIPELEQELIGYQATREENARLLSAHHGGAGLRVEMEELGAERELEPPLERAVMRIVGESLRNVAQHAHASAAKRTRCFT